MKEVVVAGICYNLNEEDKTASILQKEDDNVSEVIIPSFINDNGNTYVVTSIGHHAFAYNYCFSSITSIFIPNTITDIGEEAFGGQLSLRSIIIPNSVTNIGKLAFCGCSSIISIRIPSSVENIGEQAFSYCNSLSSIVVDAQNQRYDSRDECNAIIETKTNILIAGCYNAIIPNNVIGIGNYAFSGCDSLTSITIPNSVTSIGHHTFSSCEKITDLKLPNSIISIGHAAFVACYSLTDIILPCNITSIEQSTFQYCSSLGSINLPNRVKTIGKRAFDGCSSLSHIELPQSLLSIEMEAFGHCISLNEIVIPNNVNNIAWWAFVGCTSLTKINISSSLKGIESNVFHNCSSLRSINLDNNIMYIRHGAFHNTALYNDESNWDNGALYIGNCLIEVKHDAIKERFVIKENTRLIACAAFPTNSNLKFLTLPNSVTCIGDWAFSSCSSLVSIIMSDNIQRLGINIFDNCQSLQAICIPKGRKETYCTMGLEKYCDFILEGEYMEQEVDGINYCLNNYTLTAEVIKREGGYVGTIIIPSHVVYNKTTYVVTKIEGILIKEDFSYIIGPFVDCPELISIVIPNTVSYIGEDVFSKSISLSSIKVAPNNPQYDSRNNCNGIIETSTDTMIAGCKNTIIPNNIKIIASGAFNSTPPAIIFPKGLYRICGGAFAECSQLNTIHLPDSLQLIEEMAFSCCENLSTIEFGNGLQHIGSGAFECTAITSLILPNSVNFLGDFTFAGCTLLNSITLSKNITNIGKSVVDNCDSLQIIRVPKGKKEEYCKLGLEPYRDLLQEPQEEEYTILLNIAKGYELGIGMPKNIAQAVLLYNQAVEKGCAEAAYHLGELYEKGENLPQDYHQAIDWYAKAEALFHPSASIRRKKCEQHIHEEEQRQRLLQQETQTKYQQLLTPTYLFFDTECNGLPQFYDMDVRMTNNWPNVIQLAWIVTDEQGNVLKRKSHIITPEGFEINDNVANLTGITTSRAMREGIELTTALSDFMSDVNNAQMLIGHNIDFDMKVVGCELYRNGMDYESLLSKKTLCTMKRSTYFCAIPNPRGKFNDYKWPKLEELYRKLFNRPLNNAHDALADITATKECYFELRRLGVV